MKYFLVLLLLVSCSVKKEKTELTLKDVKFDSILGIKSTDSTKIFFLLARGMRIGSSNEADSFIETWIRENPDAKVKIVSSLSQLFFTINYCWLISGKDTINNLLVKNGYFPGSVMLVDTTFSKDIADGQKNMQTNFKLQIDSGYLGEYFKQIQAAERTARKNKVGIWAEGDTLIFFGERYNTV